MKKPARRPPAKRRPAEVRAPAKGTDVTRSVANAPVMLFELDPKGVIMLLAGGLAEQLGLRPEDAIGRNVLDLHKGNARAEDLIGRALAGDIFCTQIHIRGRILEMCFTPRRDRQERPSGLTGWATDVTERRRAEERYRAIFDGATEGILVADSQTRRFLYANPAICALLGYTAEELCRLGVEDIHPREDLPRIIEYFETQTRGEVLTAADCPCRRGDGSVVYADIKSGPARIDGRACTVGFFTDATERRSGEAARTLIEQRLKNSLHFTEALLSAIPTPVFYKDREGRYLGCNRAFSELMGVTSEQIKGKTVHELWPSKHAEVYHEKDLEVMRHPARQVYEFKVRDKDGRDRPVIYAKDVFRDDNDQVAGIVGAFLDISERKQAESALLERNTFMESLLESMRDGLCVLDPDGCRIMTNASLARMTGYSKEELLAQKPPYPFWPPEHGDRIKAAFQAILRGEMREQELVYMRKDGERFPVLLSPVCRRDEAGRVKDVILTIKDISELRKADESRRLSLSLLQATLESTTDGILVADGKGRVTSHNQRFLDIWGIPGELAAQGDDDALLAFVLDRLCEPDRFLSKVHELYAHPEAESSDTLRFKDGRLIERYSQPQRLEGKVVGRVWSFRDVTERVRAEAEKARLFEQEREARAEAEAASKSKDDFLAIVSHELRTPLTAIMGWSWLLRSGKLAEDERQNALDIILRNMQSQRQIVEDLIDVSSLSRGMFTLNRKLVDLKTLLTTDCEALQQLANSRGIRLIRTLGDAPVGVLADAGRLQQVCRNLLHNALKFTPDGGEVRVNLRQEDGQAVVEVQDSGKGIPSDFLPQLFEPFRQGEDPLTREHGGLGLGLSIVKRLVELHGGTVSAASAGKGQGSVFTVRLPAVPWPPPGEPEEAAPADRRGSLALDGLRILVVEDEEDGRLMLEQLLRRYGAVVASAADAAEALKRLEADVPDLLLCDIAMPGEDGCSLLRKVRSRGGKLGSVPAAAITALAKEDDRLRAMQAGFQIYLTKPTDPVQILEAVRALASRR